MPRIRSIRALKFSSLSPPQSVRNKEQAILVSWRIFASENNRADQILTEIVTEHASLSNEGIS
jgi:hypothetical protein